MLKGKTSDNISDLVLKKTTEGGTWLEFEACYSERSVGPSPSGRLEISFIQTPNARRDTGMFNLEVYKDYAFTQPIAILADGVYLEAGKLEAGSIEVLSVVPAEFGVQVVTTYTIEFIAEHRLYPPASIKIEFPPSIILPATETEVTFRPIGPNKD